ncbi:MAG: leucine-rich repeat protein [Acutalibacteraceae bacterium]
MPFAGDTSGSCGKNAEWYYDSKTQTLTISGKGDMYDYDHGPKPRYFADCDNIIKHLVVKEGITSIGNSAFYYFTSDSIETISLPKSLKTIGSYAFGYVSVSKIIIPSGVTTIGNHAFIDSDLEEIVIPSGVTYIGEGAFIGCKKLTSVLIPDTVKTLGKAAFESCISLSSVKMGSGITRIYEDTFKNCDALTEITIGKNVSRISSFAFSGSKGLKRFKVASGNQFFSADQYGVLYNKNKTYLKLYPVGSDLKSFTLPDSVIKIADYAFYCAEKLESVNAGKKLETIGKSAFAGAVNLQTVSFNDGLKIIDEQAFAQCQKIKEIYIPAGVSFIGFQSLSDIGFINVDPNNTVYSSDSFGVLFDKEKSELIIYPIHSEPESYRIPEGVKTIRENAFQYSTIQTVEFPSTLEVIEKFAFSQCSNLTSVTLPKQTQYIGEEAFSYCFQLTTLIIEEGSEAEIGSSAFYYCNNLVDFSISSLVYKIHAKAFENTKEYYNTKKKGKSLFYVGNVLYLANDSYNVVRNLKIKEGTLGITEFACFGLVNIELPASLKFIEESAFAVCGSSLASIKVSADNQYFVTDSSGSLYNKEMTRLIAYIHTEGRTSFTLPSSVNYIDDQAFNCGKSLEEIIINGEVSNLNFSTFYGTNVIENKKGYIYYNDTYIGMHRGDSSTEQGVLIIQDGTRAIGKTALLPTGGVPVYIPRSVKYIGYNYPCQMEVYYQGSEEEWNAIENHADTDGWTVYFNFDKNNHTHKYYWKDISYSTCMNQGKGNYCCPCGKRIDKTFPLSDHMTAYRVINCATLKCDGSKEKYCMDCYEVFGTAVIPKIASVKLDETEMVYDSSPKKPGVIIKDSKGTVINKDAYYSYRLEYDDNCDQIGAHSVTITYCPEFYSLHCVRNYTVLPGKTSKLTATANHSAIALQWNPVPGATGYKVYVSVQGKWKYLKTTSATDYRIDNLQTGKTYKYAVKAYTKVGDEVYNAADFAVITKSTHLTAPKITASSSAKGTAALKWTASPGATAYAVYVRENGAWKYLGKTAKTAYTVKGLQSGSVQTFAVRPMKTVSSGTIKGVYGTVKVKIK